MSKDEILELIAGGENSKVEFKRDSLRPEKLAKEIVALVNLNGGTLLLGVEDDGRISGVTRKNLSEWIFDTVLGRYVHPLLFPDYDEVTVDGKRVVALTFASGESKPYVLRIKNRDEAYVRLGSVTKPAGREQMARLYAAGGMLHTEVSPVLGTSLESLDMARLDNYLRDILSDPEVPTTEEKWCKRLKALGFLTVDTRGVTVCTIAGLVLFGINPRLPLRQSGIRLMAFRGLDKEYQALLDVVLDAPLVGRWQISDGSRRLIDSGLIEKFIDSVSPFISEEAAEIDENFRREKKWFYPIDAVRETVINAVAHRDWTRTVDVEVGVYSDRMDFISPGALSNSMSVDKVVAGQRSARNQIIVEVLRDYGYVDARGMGIRTKVIPLMKAYKAEPRFDATEDYFKTTLLKSGSLEVPQEKGEETYCVVREVVDNSSYYQVRKSPRTERRPVNDLLSLIEYDPKANYEALAAGIGVSPATVKRRIQALKKEGRLCRIGSKKTGQWRVIRS